MRGKIIAGGHTTPGRYFLDDLEVSKEQYDAAFPSKLDLSDDGPAMFGVQRPDCWPMISEAMAVHPSQVAEATARNKRHGINVEYLRDGRVVLNDPGQKRDLMKLEGLHANSGAYGYS